jgi:hypothetical protein
MCNKPPLGIIPEDIWKSQRKEELKKAIARYKQEELEVPYEWYQELYNG